MEKSSELINEFSLNFINYALKSKGDSYEVLDIDNYNKTNIKISNVELSNIKCNKIEKIKGVKNA